eukprot:1079093-Alexandrium_andersonii.AAC.1
MWRLLRTLRPSRCKAYVLNSDLKRFGTNTPLHQRQLNALVKYISETSSVTLVDGRICWAELKPFSVTRRRKNEID